MSNIYTKLYLSDTAFHHHYIDAHRRGYVRTPQYTHTAHARGLGPYFNDLSRCQFAGDPLDWSEALNLPDWHASDEPRRAHLIKIEYYALDNYKQIAGKHEMVPYIYTKYGVSRLSPLTLPTIASYVLEAIGWGLLILKPETFIFNPPAYKLPYRVKRKDTFDWVNRN